MNQHQSTNRDHVTVLVLTDEVLLAWFVLNQDHKMAIALVSFHTVKGSLESGMELAER
jgi:hypothetical protein